MMTASRFLDVIVGVVRQHLPPGVSARDLDSFLSRNRGLMESHIERQLGGLLARLPGPGPDTAEDPELPELWTAAKRTAANLAAMTVAAKLGAERRSPTAQERQVLRGYSGWGGLSIEGASSRFPEGFPVPEARGLIHEYYTPSKVAAEIARIVRDRLDTLPEEEGAIHALEPSAGIGRMLSAFSGVGFEDLVWHAVEWSELSGRMLHALYPKLDLYQGPFERWVRERGATWSGRLSLVVSNPPYGARGAALAEDPDRSYREKRAYAYFLRRGLDLLAPDGLGVYLIPSGFLTANTVEMRSLREQVLRRHHLAAAFRLPSVKPGGREALFPGAMLVTDLLLFRARGGELPAVDEADEGIAEGAYFQEFPRHLLGRELGRDAGDDDQTKKPRYGYQVEGEFSRFPSFAERPICADCRIIPLQVPGGSKASRVGVTRALQDDTAGLPDELAAAVSLGLRVDRYLALVAAGNTEEPAQLWSELHEALRAWVARYGNPSAHTGLQRIAQTGNTGAERFVSAFTKAGSLIPGLLNAPPKPEPRYTGRPDDVVAQAELLYRSGRALAVADLWTFHEALGGPLDRSEIVRRVLAGGWCLDGESWTELVPPDVYYTGDLWPKHDRAAARAKREATQLSPHMPAEVVQAQATLQTRKLLETIAPAVFDDIDGVSPRQGWVPLDLTAAWMNDALKKYSYDPVVLERKNGLVVLRGWDYEGLDKKSTHGEIHPDTLLLIGWMNHDKTLFSPPKDRESDSEKDLDKRRLAKAAEWEAAFKGWAGATPERRQRIEDAYNRQFRGYVAPNYSVESLPIARWKKDGPRLHPHQVAGARRVLSNGGGMVAFDVGVGKTYTGIAILARARQEGWVKRPVILVPNSIVWKWYADILRVLPDYRVAVVGSKQKIMSRGPRKGLLTSETDTPAERAEKWTRFQAGEFDVVLLTYSMLGRTRMNEEAVRAYATQVEAIQREVALRQRNAGKRKKQSEREQAILKEGVAAWVAQQMELGEDESYDPGVAFDDIGIDMLIVDEAQNFKEPAAAGKSAPPHVPTSSQAPSALASRARSWPPRASASPSPARPPPPHRCSGPPPPARPARAASPCGWTCRACPLSPPRPDRAARRAAPRSSACPTGAPAPPPGPRWPSAARPGRSRSAAPARAGPDAAAGARAGRRARSPARRTPPRSRAPSSSPGARAPAPRRAGRAGSRSPSSRPPRSAASAAPRRAPDRSPSAAALAA